MLLNVSSASIERMVEAPRAELRLKAAVIDRLFGGNHVDDDSVLVSEMTVANWARRADLVLANGKLWAFELKSQSDRLARLPGQLSTFSYCFEKFVVVVAARFENAAKEMLADGIGLWVEEEDGVLKERIRPKALPLTKEASISLMTVTELRRLLACNGVTNLKDRPRQQLESIVFGLPASDLADAARNAIKRRHRTRHAEFVKQRDGVGTLDAIRTLRRFAMRTAPEDAPIAPIELPDVSLPAGHPHLLHAPAGPVLKRAIR